MRFTSTGLDSILTAEAKTLSGLFQCRVARSAQKPAYHQYSHQQEKWISTTWQQIDDLVGDYQRALQQESLERGERLAILMGNSLEWVAIEQAAPGSGTHCRSSVYLGQRRKYRLHSRQFRKPYPCL